MTTPIDSMRPVSEDQPMGGEILISWLLRAGVALSTLLIVLGTVLTFAHHPDYVRDHTALEPLVGQQARFVHTPGEVATSLGHGHGQAVVTLGLLVLIATPFLRVALSAAVFWSLRDRLYTWITLAVLAILALSLILGHAG